MMLGRVGVAPGTSTIRFSGSQGLGLIFNSNPGRTGSVWPYGYPRWTDLAPEMFIPPYRAASIGIPQAGVSILQGHRGGLAGLGYVTDDPMNLDPYSTAEGAVDASSAAVVAAQEAAADAVVAAQAATGWTKPILFGVGGIVLGVVLGKVL